MVCDAPDGCGDTAFGEKIDISALDPDFKISGISNIEASEEEKSSAKLNVSVLTHLAAQVAESKEVVNAEVISESDKKIANTFDIKGVLTELEPTNVNDNSAVVGEDNEDERQYGLVNAGIAQAIFKSMALKSPDDTTQLSDMFADMTKDIVENDGELLAKQDQDDDFELALTDVLTSAADVAKKVAERIQADDSIAEKGTIVDDLAIIETELDNEKVIVEINTGEDGRITPIEVEEVTEDDAKAKAKAMVADVRMFYNLMTPEHTSNKELQAEASKYEELVNNAGDMLDLEAESFTLLSQLVTDLAELANKIDSGEEKRTNFNIKEETGNAELSGNIVYDEANYLFTVDATHTNGQILKFSAELTNENDDKTVKLSLSGSMETPTADITIAEGTMVKVHFNEAVNINAVVNEQFTQEQEDALVVESGELTLEISLGQKQTAEIPNPLRFSGSLLADLELVETEQLYYNYLLAVEKDAEVIPSSLTFSGSFGFEQGDSIAATLTINSANAKAYKAGEFEYIGKRLEGVTLTPAADTVFSISRSDDGKKLLIVSNIFYSGEEAIEFEFPENNEADFLENLKNYQPYLLTVFDNDLGLVMLDVEQLSLEPSETLALTSVPVRLVQPLFKDAIEVSGSDDGATAVMKFKDEELVSSTYTETEDGFEASSIIKNQSEYITKKGVSDSGMVYVAYQTNYFDRSDNIDYSYASYKQLISTDEEGYNTNLYCNGEYWQDDKLYDYDNEQIIISLDSGDCYTNSYSSLSFEEDTHSALDVLTDEYRHYWVPQIGDIVVYSDTGVVGYDSLDLGETHRFDALNVYPDADSTLENDSQYLDAAAALNVALMMGGYEIDMTLSGLRTGIEDGNFNLALSYKLPEDETKRAFTVKYATTQEDTLIATNPDGVRLVISDVSEEESVDGEDTVVGTITVGDITAAEIVDREGIIFIKYIGEDAVEIESL